MTFEMVQCLSSAISKLNSNINSQVDHHDSHMYLASVTHVRVMYSGQFDNNSEKSKIHSESDRNGGYLGFRIGMILTGFVLLVILVIYAMLDLNVGPMFHDKCYQN